MLDGILGRGFGSKCKSLIKPTRTRIDVLRRRKEATQRFLKGNLAQLLGNGLDINAYGRVKQTEEYLAGLDILSCYDFIEQSCEYILKQLSVMQKQSKCPEECREAVGSLMFAAAWFSDLPELRDLRDMFQDRYGSSLEHFVNQKFVEKLALRPPTMEKKIKLLQDIASEFLIKWDSRGFEQRMANPSASAQDQSEKYRSIHDHDNKYNLPNGKEAVTKTDKQNYSSQERSELTTDRHRVHNGGEGSLLKRNDLDRQFFARKELTGNNHKQPFMGTGQTTPKSNNYDIPFPARQGFTDGKPYTGTEQTTPRRDNYGIPFRTRGEFTDGKHELSSVSQKDTASNGVSPGSSSCGRRSEFVNSGYEVHKDSMNSVPKKDGRGAVCDGKPEAPGGVPGAPGRHDGKDVSSAGYNDFSQSNTANSTRKVRQEEERDGLKPHSSNALPPPYIKSRDKLVPPPYIKSIESKRGVNAEPKHPSSNYDGVPMSHSMRKREDNAARRSEGIRGEADHANYEEHVVGPSRVNSHRHEKDLLHQDDILLPKPRSIRRKHSKSSSSDDDLGNFEEAAGHAKRNSSSRRRDNSSRRGLQILFDDERHQKDEEERMIDKLLLHYSKKPSTCDPEKVRRKSRKAPNAGEKTPRYDSRDGPDVQAAMGAPPTRSISLPHDQAAPTEAVKVYTRANSFQPDKPAGHVHPKLPDYDDLAARFAALRGR